MQHFLAGTEPMLAQGKLFPESFSRNSAIFLLGQPTVAGSSLPPISEPGVLAWQTGNTAKRRQAGRNPLGCNMEMFESGQGSR
jgi:hypothetical protein